MKEFLYLIHYIYIYINCILNQNNYAGYLYCYFSLNNPGSRLEKKTNSNLKFIDMFSSICHI